MAELMTADLTTLITKLTAIVETL
jgi:hypothetical protein